MTTTNREPPQARRAIVARLAAMTAAAGILLSACGGGTDGPPPLVHNGREYRCAIEGGVARVISSDGPSEGTLATIFAFAPLSAGERETAWLEECRAVSAY